MNVVVVGGARSISPLKEAGVAAPNVVAVRAKTRETTMANFVVLVVDMGALTLEWKLWKIEGWSAAGFRLGVGRES